MSGATWYSTVYSTPPCSDFSSFSLTTPPVLDERAVDYFGVDVGTSENPGNIYGWGRVTETARWKPDRVRKTPDAYTMFSMAVYYTEINKWGLQFVTGVGKYWVKS